MKGGVSKGGDYSVHHRNAHHGQRGLDQRQVRHVNSTKKVSHVSQTLFHQAPAPDVSAAQNCIAGLNLLMAYFCMKR